MNSLSNRSTRVVLSTAVVLVTLLATLIATSATRTTAEPVSASSVSMTMTGPHNASQAQLYEAMRTLWAQHMEWTYATVAAFAVNSHGLDATLHRLLRNQSDIGNAVKPFYGTKAAHRLTALLMTHIKEAVPVLVAARDGDAAALKRAVSDWYANARQIADFLAHANPAWHRRAMRRMMHTHITQTIRYAGEQLQGKYGRSIRDYDQAETHMRKMADMLSSGLVQQFPRRFR